MLMTSLDTQPDDRHSNKSSGSVIFSKPLDSRLIAVNRAKRDAALHGCSTHTDRLVQALRIPCEALPAGVASLFCRVRRSGIYSGIRQLRRVPSARNGRCGVARAARTAARKQITF